ncbi:MAG: DUF2059 domain-containing protein [Pseudomonadota bacterium]|nr:DUF2059 domain-containing protein [Pseudomonadota bacterium]
MRFMIVCLAAAIAGAGLVATPVGASDTPQAATAPSARQLALTRRYIDLLMSDQFEDAIGAMIGDEMSRDITLPEEDRRFLVDLTTELATDLVPQMINEMVPVYAAAFTEAELEALIGFYDTEMGRSISAKTVQVMPEANRAVMSVMPQLLDKMAARMCQHYGCEPGELEALRQEMRAGAGLASSPAPAPSLKPGSN